MQQPSLQMEKILEDQYVMHTYGRKPKLFVEGHGMTLVDSEGKEYLDFLGGIASLPLGHSYPAVVEAIQQQAGKLMHVSNYYYATGRGELAKTISDLMNVAVPQDQQQTWQTFFANTGAEANEGAFKLARRYADMVGRPDAKTILYLKKSFHGRTMATIAATGQPAKQDIFRPLPGGFAPFVQNDIASFEQAVNDPANGEVCAVIVECIQGESGVHPCTLEFLRELRAKTAERGILMIVDEVQTGFFRCGTYPFAFQHAGIVPDIVTMAKAIASGFPMGAFAARADVARAFQPGDHGTTFGGNQLAVTAATATINAMLQLDVATNAREVGDYMRQALQDLPLVTEVRGSGLMLGVQLAKPVAVEAMTQALEQGLVINYTGPETLRFLPALICTKNDVDAMIGTLGPILAGLQD